MDWNSILLNSYIECQSIWALSRLTQQIKVKLVHNMYMNQSMQRKKNSLVNQYQYHQGVQLNDQWRYHMKQLTTANFSRMYSLESSHWLLLVNIYHVMQQVAVKKVMSNSIISFQWMNWMNMTDEKYLFYLSTAVISC